MKLSNCRSCDAPILWALTRRRARMPLDAAETKPADFSGALANVYALLATPGVVPLAVNLRDISGGFELWQSGDLSGRLSHFATCPNSAEHRKPREPGTTLAERGAA